MIGHVFIAQRLPHRSELRCSCGWAWWGPPSSDEELERYQAEHRAAAREAERQEEAEHG